MAAPYTSIHLYSMWVGLLTELKPSLVLCACTWVVVMICTVCTATCSYMWLYSASEWHNVAWSLTKSNYQQKTFSNRWQLEHTEKRIHNIMLLMYTVCLLHSSLWLIVPCVPPKSTCSYLQQSVFFLVFVKLVLSCQTSQIKRGANSDLCACTCTYVHNIM